MFTRIKKSGQNQYVQLVENRKENGKVKQRVVATLGRLDEMHAKDRIEILIRSLVRFSEKILLVLSGNIDAETYVVRIGSALIFDRLWHELWLPKIIEGLLAHWKFEFNVERATFLTVLHRLCISGSDRNADLWRRDYAIDGVDGLSWRKTE